MTADAYEPGSYFAAFNMEPQGDAGRGNVPGGSSDPNLTWSENRLRSIISDRTEDAEVSLDRRIEDAEAIFNDNTLNPKLNPDEEARFLFNKKNEAFQDLLDEEFDRIQRRKSVVPDYYNKSLEGGLPDAGGDEADHMNVDEAIRSVENRIQEYIRKSDKDMLEALDVQLKASPGQTVEPHAKNEGTSNPQMPAKPERIAGSGLTEKTDGAAHNRRNRETLPTWNGPTLSPTNGNRFNEGTYRNGIFMPDMASPFVGVDNGGENFEAPFTQAFVPYVPDKPKPANNAKNGDGESVYTNAPIMDVPNTKGTILQKQKPSPIIEQAPPEIAASADASPSRETPADKAVQTLDTLETNVSAVPAGTLTKAGEASEPETVKQEAPEPSQGLGGQAVQADSAETVGNSAASAPVAPFGEVASTEEADAGTKPQPTDEENHPDGVESKSIATNHPLYKAPDIINKEVVFPFDNVGPEEAYEIAHPGIKSKFENRETFMHKFRHGGRSKAADKNKEEQVPEKQAPTTPETQEPPTPEAVQAPSAPMAEAVTAPEAPAVPIAAPQAADAMPPVEPAALQAPDEVVKATPSFVAAAPGILKKAIPVSSDVTAQPQGAPLSKPGNKPSPDETLKPRKGLVWGEGKPVQVNSATTKPAAPASLPVAPMASASPVSTPVDPIAPAAPLAPLGTPAVGAVAAATAIPVAGTLIKAAKPDGADDLMAGPEPSVRAVPDAAYGFTGPEMSTGPKPFVTTSATPPPAPISATPSATTPPPTAPKDVAVPAVAAVAATTAAAATIGAVAAGPKPESAPPASVPDQPKVPDRVKSDNKRTEREKKNLEERARRKEEREINDLEARQSREAEKARKEQEKIAKKEKRAAARQAEKDKFASPSEKEAAAQAAKQKAAAQADRKEKRAKAVQADRKEKQTQPAEKTEKKEAGKNAAVFVAVFVLILAILAACVLGAVLLFPDSQVAEFISSAITKIVDLFRGG